MSYNRSDETLNGLPVDNPWIQMNATEEEFERSYSSPRRDNNSVYLTPENRYGSRDRLYGTPSPQRRSYSPSPDRYYYSPSHETRRLPQIPKLSPFDDKEEEEEEPTYRKREDPFVADRPGYEYNFEPDAESDRTFVPFPNLNNSYYPINTPKDYFDPFDYRYDDSHEEEDIERDDYSESGASVTSARQVRMVNGNLVLDCPVSDVLLSKYTTPLSEKDREFLFMRFQACTCEPAEFAYRNFSLRQCFYSQPRSTEMMVVITMYNENEILLARTLKGVFKNIRHLYSMQHSSTWGQDAWQKVVVCVVSDGRTKINPKSKALLGALGVYQEGFAKNKVNDDKVVSHIYEYTTMVGISKVEHDHVKLTTENQIPIQMIFCLKETNQKKINSHAWAFEAFGPILRPNVVVLLDVGTEPEGKALYKLWKAFKDPRVAGACGEIKASLGRNCRLLLNPLVAAQNFEYKISNILDKPMESVFGFVTVLPGAFSAYRYQALLGAPLQKYLKGEDLKRSNDGGIFNANMYLAEDRILCFELVAKQNCEWLLKYVSSAAAHTDVPEQLHDFISQRRRWLNGSFFAAIYSLFHFYKVWHTSHSFGRKVMLHIQFLYQFINLLVSWFSLGSYFLVFRILTVYLAEPEADFAPGNILSVFFLWLYLASIVTTFVLSFGNKPKGTKRFYLIIVTFFAILMVYMIFAAVFMAVKSIQTIIKDHSNDFSVKLIFTETKFRDLIVATTSTYALYFIGSFIFLDPCHMFTSFVQYLLLSPAYINVLNIYAFCNIHDISWGTKGDDLRNDLGEAKVTKNAQDGELEIVIPTTKTQIDVAYRKIMNELTTTTMEVEAKVNQEEEDAFYFAFIRSMTVLVWMITNFIIIALVTEAGGLYQFTPDDSSSTDYLPATRISVFLTVILWIVAFMALFRFIGCCAYLISKLVDRIKLRKFRREYQTKGASFAV
ncbi:hypothetical protein OGAPHI_000531 [Ogataea philodendri]|uniref:Chitin synthase n=1 Tax=Ogataea philodendri TaxID=1378263 RepID=A0A9P8PFF9_9ASCO|nr:uncharacterized protein OGAPHI_000531 [Ogataea philodendri]KAH3671308.1 hypothetical protein OGAPHI_000531 [Ogataea philodendri]